MLSVENSVINIGENFGLLKFNDNVNFSYIFDVTKLDNHYFYIDEINEIFFKPDYINRFDVYHIVLTINNHDYFLTLELKKPNIQLSNNIINIAGSKHIGFISNSDFSSKYEYITTTPNFQIIKNDLYIIDNSIVSKYIVNIKAYNSYVDLDYDFQIYVIPQITISNNVVYLNDDDFLIGNILNSDNDYNYEYKLDSNLGDNKYFDILDDNKIVVKDNSFNNKDDLYTIIITTIIMDISFNTSIFINISKIKNMTSNMKIVLSDDLKYNYHFSKQLTDILEFTISSVNIERKLKLIFLSGGSLYLSGTNKIEDNTIIYLQPDIDYYFQYQNKDFNTNKVIFHIIDNSNNYGILEIMITLNNQIFNKIHFSNMESISKANHKTTIKTLNPNVNENLVVQVFKLDNKQTKKCVSKLVNGCQIFYTHDINDHMTRSINNNISLVIEPITLSGNLSNLPAFYIKYIDNDSLESLVSVINPIELVLYLPNYKGATNLSAYRLHDTMSGYDGTVFPLTPYYNTANNCHFSLRLTTNSIYTINNTNYGAQCFLRGSSILTPNGYEKVENLHEGDIVFTHKLKETTIRNIIKLLVPSNKNNDPYLIPKNTFGAITDLYLSPLHQILIGDTFVPVKYIPNLKQKFMGFNLEYYHFKTDDYFTDTVIADGVITETWSGIDPMDIEFNSEFSEKYEMVKMEHNYRKLVSTN